MCVYTAELQSFTVLSYISQTRRQFTIAQTYKLDQSFMPTVNIITAGEAFQRSPCVNDECVWK